MAFVARGLPGPSHLACSSSPIENKQVLRNRRIHGGAPRVQESLERKTRKLHVLHELKQFPSELRFYQHPAGAGDGMRPMDEMQPCPLDSSRTPSLSREQQQWIGDARETGIDTFHHLFPVARLHRHAADVSGRAFAFRRNGRRAKGSREKHRPFMPIAFGRIAFSTPLLLICLASLALWAACGWLPALRSGSLRPLVTYLVRRSQYQGV